MSGMYFVPLGVGRLVRQLFAFWGGGDQNPANQVENKDQRRWLIVTQAFLSESVRRCLGFLEERACTDLGLTGRSVSTLYFSRACFYSWTREIYHIIFINRNSGFRHGLSSDQHGGVFITATLQVIFFFFFFLSCLNPSRAPPLRSVLLVRGRVLYVLLLCMWCCIGGGLHEGCCPFGYL